jgi:FG-GAP repeat/FG-GAP-like repeat
VGGLNDNNGVGAAWVFTRSNGVWTQQAKLVGNDAVGNTHQGISVALSGDGNTAIVGGPQDNNGAGAVWVFTRSGGQWTQQGSKLVGSDAVGKAGQGSSVALSGDGNLVIVDGPGDNDGTANEVGAAWLFARSDGTWSQLQKLANNGEAGFAQAFFGASVALSADGRTAMVGVPGVVNGGSFVFIGPNRRATDTPDFNGDGYSDILWRDTSGNVAIWEMNGTTVLNPNTAGVGNVPTTWSIAGTGDFNGLGLSDILWRDTSGNIAIWFMFADHIKQSAGLGNISTVWSIQGVNAD